MLLYQVMLMSSLPCPAAAEQDVGACLIDFIYTNAGPDFDHKFHSVPLFQLPFLRTVRDPSR